MDNCLPWITGGEIHAFIAETELSNRANPNPFETLHFASYWMQQSITFPKTKREARNSSSVASYGIP